VVPSLPVHNLCLDLIDVRWETSSAEKVAESAIILEIWKGHASLQTSSLIPLGSKLTIGGGPGLLSAEVSACDQDGEYGFLVEVECDGLSTETTSEIVPAWIPPADITPGLSTALPC